MCYALLNNTTASPFSIKQHPAYHIYALLHAAAATDEEKEEETS